MGLSVQNTQNPSKKTVEHYEGNRMVSSVIPCVLKAPGNDLYL